MQIIVHGAGAQPVEIYATDALGRPARPSSATARIVDLLLPDGDPGREIEPLGPATVDAFATTTTAAAGPREASPRKISLTIAAGLEVGVRYLIESAGVVESFVLDRVDGLDAWARDDLRNRFETGADVRGYRATFDFPALVADDAAQLAVERIFGVDWTLAGVTGPAQLRTLAKIERRQAAPRATTADLLRLAPALALLYRERSHLDTHLAQADLEISAMLRFRGTVVEREHHGEIGQLATCYRALELAYRQLGEADYTERTTWAAGEAKRWAKMLTDGHRPTDAAETTSTQDKIPPRRRTVMGVI